MKKILPLVCLLILPLLNTAQKIKDIHEIAPFNEGMAAVRKGNEWGFINQEGKLIIDYRSDLVWDKNADTKKSDISGIRYPQFRNGRCVVKKIKDEGIPYYGFIDTHGELVIEHDFLNITEFEGGFSIGVLCKKRFKGKNEFQLRIFKYEFGEVIIDTSGKVVEYIGQRDHILMNKRSYEIPALKTKLLSDKLLAVNDKNGRWTIHKFEP